MTTTTNPLPAIFDPNHTLLRLWDSFQRCMNFYELAVNSKKEEGQSATEAILLGFSPGEVKFLGRVPIVVTYQPALQASYYDTLRLEMNTHQGAKQCRMLAVNEFLAGRLRSESECNATLPVEEMFAVALSDKVLSDTSKGIVQILKHVPEARMLYAKGEKIVTVDTMSEDGVFVTRLPTPKGQKHLPLRTHIVLLVLQK